MQSNEERVPDRWFYIILLLIVTGLLWILIAFLIKAAIEGDGQIRNVVRSDCLNTFDGCIV